MRTISFFYVLFFPFLVFAAKQTPRIGTGGLKSFLIPMLLLFVVWYFLLIRPQQNKEKKRQSMITNLRKGDRVVTSGGIYGTVVETKEKSVVLKVSNNVSIEFSKSSVSQDLNQEQKSKR